MFYRFLRLYSTELVKKNKRFIVDPVTIEFFEGPRTYTVMGQSGPAVVAAGTDQTIVRGPKQLAIPSGRYIALIARTKEFSGARQWCEDQIDRTATKLSVQLSSYLFVSQLWNGWLSEEDKVLIADAWLAVIPPITPPDDLETQMELMSKAIETDKDLSTRFTLMSKLYTRAVGTLPGEARFLWMWSVLEVFPMKDTSDIQPISDYLSNLTGKSANEVKAKLGIGKLFGARSDLVHDGKLPYERKELGEVLARLETVVLTVMKGVCGLPYSGDLDQYFK